MSNAGSVDIKDLEKDKCQTVVHSVKAGGTVMELHNSTSTQSLGVNSNAGESVIFGKGGSTLKKVVVFLTIVCILLIAACVSLTVLYLKELQSNTTEPPSTKAPTSAPAICLSTECLKIAAEFTNNINKSVDPCEDFYHFACDGWIRDNPIPPSENEQATFYVLSKATSEKLRSILEGATDLPPGDPVRKARDYYVSCMDEREAERTADDQIQNLIRKIGSWSLGANTTGWNGSTWDWKDALFKIHKELNVESKSPLFSIDVVENPRDSTKYLIKINLPHFPLIKEQYTMRKAKVRDAYLDFMVETAVILGCDNNTAYEQMKEVLEFEIKLAEISPNKAVLQNQFFDTYTLKEIEDNAYNFSWVNYLNKLFDRYGIRINDTETIIVPSPKYLANMTKLVDKESKKVLSNYFVWNVVRNLVPFLSKPFREAEMRYKKKASNTLASKPRWEECIKSTDYSRGLTFALGYKYIEKLFDKSFIPKIRSMMNDMRRAFREEVTSLSWIDNTTRKSVFDKEKDMVEKIGFPNLCANYTLLDLYYKNLKVDDTHYLLNEVNVSRWYTEKVLSRLREPVNKDAWFYGPQMINAFYLREQNEINILAGILQPPFFYGSKAPSVVNYGGIGMVLAHELTHGFDTIGRKFNNRGELTGTSGWTKASMDTFHKKANCIAKQYSKYSVEVDTGPIYLDGNLTLDENIADNGGLLIAYKAYQSWTKKHGPQKLIPGLEMSNDQMFFLSYAQMWCSIHTPAARFARAKAGTHSSPKFRVKGPLVNSEAFAKAYNCPLGSTMNPGKRCRVW